ncbi:MAG: LL-diaminopimelate aminotransferase [Candidatus Altiarchaeota archaeon]
MVKRNENLSKLPSGYLFPEIERRKRKLMEENPKAKIISFGIGNTTEPLTPHITQALKKASEGLGTPQGYSGYGDEQGFTELRSKIAEKIYRGKVEAEEVFISDGAKCDIGRLQVMFGPSVKVAIQDPSYPVYVDGSVVMGAAGDYNLGSGHFSGITYMACTPENNFFPNLAKTPKTDLIYFCSPNNPTGAASTKDELKELVDFAKKNHSIIVYDAAYAEFIRDKTLPKTIYAVEGARGVAIEVNSFSKTAGFTGVRLGWATVPSELRFDDGTQVNKDWNRITTTIFNGASNLAQHGGLAILDDKGLEEIHQTIDYYMENARIIKDALEGIGIKTYGGTNAPYIWAHFKGRKSWDVFEEMLTKANVVTTPGSGFGPAGEGFIRFSAFGHRADVLEAVERLKKNIGYVRR